MSKLRPTRVYISGPMTTGGDMLANVRAAVRLANGLMEWGYVPFCPHLSIISGLLHSFPHSKWLECDIEWIKVCDSFIRLPGESEGAGQEEDHALIYGPDIVHVTRTFVEEVLLRDVRFQFSHLSLLLGWGLPESTQEIAHEHKG